VAMRRPTPLNEATAAEPAGLRRSIGALGFFNLSFGAIVGSGWVVVLGDWLARGGPGGTVAGLLAGGAIMTLIGLCYAELAARMPVAGGEFLYARESLGPGAAFAVGWFLTLKLIAICAFEGIALGLMLQRLLPGIGDGALYHLLGAKVSGLALAAGWAIALGLGALNLTGSKLSVRFHNFVTIGFIAIIAVTIVVGVSTGSPRNLQPIFPDTPEILWWHGALWVFSLSGMFLNGFQASMHAMEERSARTPLRGAVLSMVGGIPAAAFFYGAIVIGAAMATPWQSLLDIELPAAAAFTNSLSFIDWAVVVLVAATLSLLKTWNAMLIMASRLIFAQARLGYLPAGLARVSMRSGAPRNAILLVTILTVCAVPLGGGVILPIINMCAMCLAVSYTLCIAILLRQRARDTATTPPPAFRVPGGAPTIRLALVGATLMAAAAILSPALQQQRIPMEWLSIAAWALVGLIVWKIAVRRTFAGENR